MIIQVTPRGMLNTFFRHRYKFGSIFILIFGLAATYCAIATPKFESDAALLVKFAPNQPARNDGLPSVGITAQQLERKEVVNSQIGVLQSNDLLVSVLNTVTIGTLYPSLASIPDVNQRYGKALMRLNKDLDVQPQKDASIIWLSLLNPDANVAARALNALIDKFIGKQSAIYQSEQLPFMQRQLEDARKQLEKSRAAVQAFKAATGINSLDEERTLLLRQQSDNQESLTQAISRQQEAQGRFQRLEALLKNMPAEIKLSDENDRFKAVDDSTAAPRRPACAAAPARNKLSLRQHDDGDLEQPGLLCAAAIGAGLPAIGGPGPHRGQSRTATGRDRPLGRRRRPERRDRQPDLL